MSGHSKWSTIKRQKGAADVKRGMTFTKVSNAISLAARLGNSGDPSTNPRLRLALEQARSVNMPKDNIQRAIDRGLGNLPGQVLEEVIYEGFGPSKVAFIVETVTDNKMRTLQEIRNIFDRSGGGLGSIGSSAYLFEKKGEIKVSSQGKPADDEILELIDLGAEDVEDYEEEGAAKYLVYVEPVSLNHVSNKITQSGFLVNSSALIFKPVTTIKLAHEDEIKKVIEFTQKLEDHDDVQNVYANFDIED